MNKITLIIVVVVVAIVGYSTFVTTQGTGGAGMTSHLQVATTTTVGPDLNTELFASNGYCRARVISTVGTAIMITLADPTNGNISSTTLSGTVGNVQPASTTVTYSSDDVGCGRVFGYAAASTTITTQEF